MSIPQSFSTRQSGDFVSPDGLPSPLEGTQTQTAPIRLTSRPSPPPDIWRQKNTSASQHYEAALDEKSHEGHRSNQERIAQGIASLRDVFVQDHPDGAPADFRKVVESSLEAIIKTAEFDTSPYTSKISQQDDADFIHGYGKYLLYGADNLDAPFCLQYFHFSPGQKTPIHDHPVPCTSLVVRGQLVERRYSAVSGSEARKIERMTRPYFDRKNFLDISLPNIHSLKNKQAEFSGSVHFYYIDGDIHSRAVKSIFLKARKEERLENETQ